MILLSLEKKILPIKFFVLDSFDKSGMIMES